MIYILRPDWKIIERISKREIIFMWLSDEVFGKLNRNSRMKYKILIKGISPSDLTDFMKSALKEIEIQLQK